MHGGWGGRRGRAADAGQWRFRAGCQGASYGWHILSTSALPRRSSALKPNPALRRRAGVSPHEQQAWLDTLQHWRTCGDGKENGSPEGGRAPPAGGGWAAAIFPPGDLSSAPPSPTSYPAGAGLPAAGSGRISPCGFKDSAPPALEAAGGPAIAAWRAQGSGCSQGAGVESPAASAASAVLRVEVPPPCSPASSGTSPSWQPAAAALPRQSHFNAGPLAASPAKYPRIAFDHGSDSVWTAPPGTNISPPASPSAPAAASAAAREVAGQAAWEAAVEIGGGSVGSRQAVSARQHLQSWREHAGPGAVETPASLRAEEAQPGTETPAVPCPDEMQPLKQAEASAAAQPGEAEQLERAEEFARTQLARRRFQQWHGWRRARAARILALASSCTELYALRKWLAALEVAAALGCRAARHFSTKRR